MSTPRSLAEALRSRDDRSLAALLRGRPDLITPVPTDLTQLATRAGTRASVVRALGAIQLVSERSHADAQELRGARSIPIIDL